MVKDENSRLHLNFYKMIILENSRPEGYLREKVLILYTIYEKLIFIHNLLENKMFRSVVYLRQINEKNNLAIQIDNLLQTRRPDQVVVN